MSATPREIVHQTLEFAGPPRAARDLWVLPIAAERFGAELAELNQAYPPDLTAIAGHERDTAPTRGAPYAIGEFTDEWGCTFINIQRGVIGQLGAMRGLGFLRHIFREFQPQSHIAGIKRDRHAVIA